MSKADVLADFAAGLNPREIWERQKTRARTRKPIEALLDALDWTELPEPDEMCEGKLPYATHRGVLRIGDVELKVFKLSDGQRVIDAEDLGCLFERF